MLIEFFREVKNHYQMGYVMQEFGGPIDEKPIHSYPHIVWMPTQDFYIYPANATERDLVVTSPQDGLGNEKYFAYTSWSRVCGCNLYIYESTYEKMEILINLVHNVLYDVANSKANFRLDGNPGTGRWRPREQLSENTVCYIQEISVIVPIYRLYPTAEPITEVITLNPLT